MNQENISLAIGMSQRTGHKIALNSHDTYHMIGVKRLKLGFQ